MISQWGYEDEELGNIEADDSDAVGGKQMDLCEVVMCRLGWGGKVGKGVEVL